jgi:ABC-type uncharacterized transport system substrate-binding protein
MGCAISGYEEGRNLILERRSAEGAFDRLNEIAVELVRLNPEVIVTGGSNSIAQELKHVTKVVPIVMPNSDDPVAVHHCCALSRA